MKDHRIWLKKHEKTWKTVDLNMEKSGTGPLVCNGNPGNKLWWENDNLFTYDTVSYVIG